MVELPDCPWLTGRLDQTCKDEVGDLLMDYLTAPPSIQQQEMGKWEEAWDVINKNDREIVEFLNAKCGDEFDMFHLCFSGCIGHAKNRARPSSLLAAIADFVDNNQPKVYSCFYCRGLLSGHDPSF